MADITDQHDHTSPNDLDDAHSVGNGNAPVESRGIKRARPSAADDDDDDDDKGGRERRKIEIKFISDKSRRHITFSKRKAGIMKKVCCFRPPRHLSPDVVGSGGATTRRVCRALSVAVCPFRPRSSLANPAFFGCIRPTNSPS